MVLLVVVDAGSDGQQAVAQLLRLGVRQRAVRQQDLGPGDQVDRGQGEFQPCGRCSRRRGEGKRLKPVSCPCRT